MNKYIEHLINDMQQAAKNLPAKPFYDIPPEAEGIEYIIEWENAKSKPMQEWFGIAKENFPPAEKLSEEELTLMVDEILKLWEAYHFEAVLPDDLPAGVAYKVLTGYFDQPVAWVSEGTVNIEFCDYDPGNCPFPKKFCWCREFENETADSDMSSGSDNAAEIAALDREIKAIEDMGPDEFLPEKKMERYVEQLVRDIQAAAKPFVQPEIIPETPENRGVEDYRQLMENSFITIGDLTGINGDAFPEHICMDGLQTRKVLRAMLYLLDVCRLKIYFPKQAPHEIKYEALREYWNIYYVKHLPLSGDEIELCTGDPMTCPYGEYCDCGEEWTDDDDDFPNDFPEEINGFYNDDGTKIDPESVPVPNLCVICKIHLADDWEENMLCLLNRNDQRNDDDFKCGMFEKI
ncbi:MAG: hypothetical protein ACOCWK_03240 [Tangfeifania sp.]